MPKKCTIEDVRAFLLNNDKECECTLLSNEYINNKSPLQFKCNKCGELFERSFEKVKMGRFSCRSCSMKKSSSDRKTTLKEVEEYLQKNAPKIQLLSTEYINSKTPLKMKCVCGKEFEKTFWHIKSDKYITCASCAHKYNGFQTKYTEEDVKKIIEPLGYTLLGDYINSHTPVKCQCSQGHIFDFYLTGYLNDGRTCRECSIAHRSGQNAYNWKGGISQLHEALRNSTDSWKKQVLSKYPLCDITGSCQELEVHHLNKNFSSIVDQALGELNLTTYSTISNYSTEELKALRDKVKELHNDVKGVTLTKNLHQSFHQIYGCTNNTEQQYIEFKENIRKDKLYGNSNYNTTDDSTN